MQQPGDSNVTLSPQQQREVAAGRSMTVKELADEFSYNPKTVRRLIGEGRIVAWKPLGGQWRIPLSEVARLRQVGPPPAAPGLAPEDVDVIHVPPDQLHRIAPGAAPPASGGGLKKSWWDGVGLPSLLSEDKRDA